MWHFPGGVAAAAEPGTRASAAPPRSAGRCQGRSLERGDHVNDDSTTIDDVLADLRRSNPDAARSERIRARCHRKLKRPPFRRAVESGVVGGFCAVYLAVLA